MQLQHGCEGGGGGMLRDALAPRRSHTFFTTGFQYSFLVVWQSQASRACALLSTRRAHALETGFAGFKKKEKRNAGQRVANTREYRYMRVFE